jgi:hypothetical protein
MICTLQMNAALITSCSSGVPVIVDGVDSCKVSTLSHKHLACPTGTILDAGEDYCINKETFAALQSCAPGYTYDQHHGVCESIDLMQPTHGCSETSAILNASGQCIKTTLVDAKPVCTVGYYHEGQCYESMHL